jgi:hypothetical protein
MPLWDPCGRDLRTRTEERAVVLFGLNTWALTAVLAGIMLTATFAGLAVGRALGARSDRLREPFGILQGALVGFMGLVLAFGLTLAVGRYEARRANVVAEANAIGTTYLRAQTLAEPVRTESLDLLRRYTEVSISISDAMPGSTASDDAIADSGRLQDQLWALAGESLAAAPVDSAPRLYVETLNEMFDAQADRVYGLSNRVPTTVLLLEVAGAAVAIAALALHLATFGRGVLTVLVASLLVTVLLLVTFDLDRPTRGLIRIPATPLVWTSARRWPNRSRTRPAVRDGRRAPSAQVDRFPHGQRLRHPAPDRPLHGQVREGGGGDPRGLARLVPVTVGVSPDRAGAEQHRELLADPTLDGADHVAGVGEQADHAGHRHLHAGLLGDLPHGGLHRALPHVDPAAGQLPGAAVTSADEQQAPVQPPHGDEHRGDDTGRQRRQRIVEVHLPRHCRALDRRHDLASSRRCVVVPRESTACPPVRNRPERMSRTGHRPVGGRIPWSVLPCRGAGTAPAPGPAVSRTPRAAARPPASPPRPRNSTARPTAAAAPRTGPARYTQ